MWARSTLGGLGSRDCVRDAPGMDSDPAEFPHALLVVASDIPAGVTLAEWRKRKRPPAPKRGGRLRGRLTSLRARRADAAA